MIANRRSFMAGAAALAVSIAIPSIAATIPSTPRKRIIMPAIFWVEHSTEFVEENTRTTVYLYMERWDIDTNIIERTKVGSDAYRQWLIEDPHPIPPHLAFAGCVVSGEGDPTFYPRWQARTIKHVAEGRL